MKRREQRQIVSRPGDFERNRFEIPAPVADNVDQSPESFCFEKSSRRFVDSETRMEADDC